MGLLFSLQNRVLAQIISIPEQRGYKFVQQKGCIFPLGEMIAKEKRYNYNGLVGPGLNLVLSCPCPKENNYNIV